jgi:hypothetical protein
MQEILTWIVILVALSIVAYKAVESLKSFKKTDTSCTGCGCACSGCPVSPSKRSTQNATVK